MVFGIYIKLFFSFLIISTNIFSQNNLNSKTKSSKNDFILNSEFITGADVSYYNQMRDNGAVYDNYGIQTDLHQILKNYWFNYVRLRLFHTPADGYNDLEQTLAMASIVKENGLKLLLDFHYSDSWADPGQQTKPAAWANLPFIVLKDSIYNYTKYVISRFKEQNILPDMIQLGNEIVYGFLWNDGRVGDEFDTDIQWQQFTQLLNSAKQGVNDAIGINDSIEIMIHVHCGANNGWSNWFYNKLLSYGFDFDVIGLSFYTWWGNTLDEVGFNMNSLAQTFNKDIVLVEIAYPWTLENLDNFPNMVNSPNQLQAGFDATIEGQKAYLEEIISLIKNVPNGKGRGFFYYSPDVISTPLMSSWGENTALFGFTGNVLPSFDAVLPEDIERVTLKLNSASIPDTIGINSFFEVRGALDGNAPVVLPDSNVLDWNENSTLEPQYIGDDLFVTTFFVSTNSQIQFKYWSQAANNIGLGGGWETGVTGTNEYGDAIIYVDRDTTLPVHFFNCSNEMKPYDWLPWERQINSVAVWFRVYMATVDGVNKGYNPASPNLEIGIRGNDFNGNGPLNWENCEVLLNRETDNTSLPGFHIYSGVVYYPDSLAGQTQYYKFFIEPNGWESCGDHAFSIPLEDNTLHWTYFGNSNPVIVNVDEEPVNVLGKFILSNNYPNPFNPSTKISWQSPVGSHQTIKVFDVLGNEIATLVDEYKPAGRYETEFRPESSFKNLPAGRQGPASGVYFCQLQTDNYFKTIKMLYLK